MQMLQVHDDGNSIVSRPERRPDKSNCTEDANSSLINLNRERSFNFEHDVMAVLSVRARHALSRLRVKSVKQLLALGEDELRRTYAVGRKTADEILSLQSALQDITLVPDLKQLAIRYDMAVLSVRARHALSRLGVKSVEQLLALGEDELRRTYAVGRKTADEILSLQSALQDITLVPDLKQLAIRYDLPISEMLRKYLEMRHEGVTGGSPFIFRLVRDKSVEILKEKLLTSFDGVSAEALIAQLPEAERLSQEDKSNVLEQLVQSGGAYRDVATNLYFPCLDSILDYVAKIPKEKDRKILEMRLQGMTLEDIGQKCLVSRERVRQICSKWLDRRPKVLREDRYRNDYTQRKWSEEAFCAHFNESPQVFRYLQLVYPSPDKAGFEFSQIEFVDEKDKFRQYLQIERGLSPITAAKYIDIISSSLGRMDEARRRNLDFFEIRDSAQFRQIKTVLFDTNRSHNLPLLKKVFWAYLDYRGIHMETDPAWADDEEVRQRKFVALLQSQGFGPDAVRQRLSAINAVSSSLTLCGRLHGSLFAIADSEQLNELYSYWRETNNLSRQRMLLSGIAFRAYLRFCGVQTVALDGRRRRASWDSEFRQFLSTQKNMSGTSVDTCVNSLQKIEALLGKSGFFSEKSIEKTMGVRRSLLDTQIQKRVQLMGALGQWKALALFLEFLGAGKAEIEKVHPLRMEKRIRLKGMPASFVRYLTDVRKLAPVSLYGYAKDLGRFSWELRNRGVVQRNIYEVQNQLQLEKLEEHLPPYVVNAFRVYQAFIVSLKGDLTLPRKTNHVDRQDRVAKTDVKSGEIERFAKDIREQWPEGFDFSDGAVRLLESHCGKMTKGLQEILKAGLFHPRGRLWFCPENVASDETRSAVVELSHHLVGAWGMAAVGVLAELLDFPDTKLRNDQDREAFVGFLARQSGLSVCEMDGDTYVVAAVDSDVAATASALSRLIEEFIEKQGRIVPAEAILEEFPCLNCHALVGLMARCEPDAIPEQAENGVLYFKLLSEYYLPEDIGKALQEGVARAEEEGMAPTAAWLSGFLSERYGCDFAEDYALDPVGALKWAISAVWRKDEANDLRRWEGEGARARFVAEEERGEVALPPRDLSSQVEAAFPGVFTNEDFWQYSVGHYGLSNTRSAKIAQLGSIAPCFVRLDRDHWMSVEAFRRATGWDDTMSEAVAKVLREALGTSPMLPVASLGASLTDALPEVVLHGDDEPRVLRWTPELVASVAALLCPGVHVANHGANTFAVSALLVSKPMDSKDVFAHAMGLYCARNPHHRDVKEAFAFLQANQIRFRFTARVQAEIEGYFAQEGR